MKRRRLSFAAASYTRWPRHVRPTRCQAFAELILAFRGCARVNILRRMVLWVICIALVGAGTVVGSKRGGIRAAFTLLGLLLGGMLGVVLGGVFANLLELVGLRHPGYSMALGPILAVLLGLLGW